MRTYLHVLLFRHASSNHPGPDVLRARSLLDLARFVTILGMALFWLSCTRRAEGAGGGEWVYAGYQHSPIPQEIAVPMTGVTAIAAGGDHTVAIQNDGTVSAWGWNGYGQTSVPAGLSSVTAIAAGRVHTVALKNDGTVVAWGRNSEGQTTVPAGLSGVTAIAAGFHHTVALNNDGTVEAWGWNDNGQATVPAGLGGVTAIAAGYYHTVALKSDGTVVAWGYNGYGQTTVPAGLAGVTAIAAGGEHTVALKYDGTVVTWGYNGNGEITVPAGLGGVTAITAGHHFTLALKNDGTVIAWGGNGQGQTTVPAGLSDVTAIAAGCYYHTVALKNDGTVVAWGYNGYGQTSVPVGLSGVISFATGYNHSVALKDDGTVVAWGNSGTSQTTVPAGLSGVTAIVAGGYHTVALENEGTIVAWGYNSEGQTTVPAGLSGVSVIAAGEYHTVALKNDGMVVAWGSNSSGQTTVPAGLSGVISVAAGTYHTVALKMDGTVVAWGNNGYGQTTVPAGLSGVTAISAGVYHTVALKNDGTVVEWGGPTQSAVWSELSGVISIAAGGHHTVALKDDGSVVAWGDNSYGQTTLPAAAEGGVTTIAAGSTARATFYRLNSPASSPGQLDHSFSADGIATAAPPGITSAKAWAMTVAPDVKIVMVGEGNTGTRSEVLVARFLPDGQLDVGFDSDGWVSIPVGAGGDTARGVVVEDDGMIVVCGRTQNATLDSFALRLTSTGALDPSFGNAGKVVWSHGGSSDDEANAVALAGPEEDIILAGSSNAGGTYDFAITRLNSDGDFDADFGSGGKTLVPLGSSTDLAYGIAVDPMDNSLLVCGAAYILSYDLAMIRLSSSGVLVPGFGNGGKVTADVFGNADFGMDVVLQPDGKVVLGGFANNGSNQDVAVLRFYSNGSLDSTFSGDGKATAAIGSGNDVGNGVKIDSSGRIVVAAEVQVGAQSDFGVARFSSTGAPDLVFTRPVALSGGADRAYDLAIDGAGRILLGGTANEGPGGAFALARVLGDPIPEIEIEHPAGTGLTDNAGSVSFGDVAPSGSSNKTFTIRNTGSATLTDIVVSVGGADSGDFAPGALGTSSLAPGASTTFDITFTPESQGARNAVLLIESNDFDEDPFEIAITGTCISRPPVAHDRTVRAPAPGHPVPIYSSGADVTEPDGEPVALGIVSHNVPGTASILGGFVMVNLTAPVSSQATITVRATDPNGAFDDAVILLTAALPGSLDPSFDWDGAGPGGPPGFGILAVPGSHAMINDIKIQPDGKIVAAGHSGPRAAVARFNSNGTVDGSFGNGGLAELTVGSDARFRRMELQPDGKIVAVGYGTTPSLRYLVARFTAEGHLDASFSDDGWLTIEIGPTSDFARGVTIQPDEKIVVAGYSYSGSSFSQSVVRLNSNGSFDTTFDGDGKLVISYGGNSLAERVALVAQGKILLMGNADVGGSSDMCATRILSNGTLDDSFGTGGKVTISLSSGHDYCEAVVLQPDDKILLAGRLNGPPEDFALVRLNPNGSLDATFDEDGKRVLPISASYDLCWDIAIQPDGKIVAAGVVAGSYEDMLVVRLNPSGALDTTFDTDGICFLTPGINDDGLFSVEVEADGDIIAGGYSEDESGVKRMAVVKLNGLGADPEIVVEQSAGTALVSGTGLLDLGDVLVGSTVLRTITIRNSGAGPLVFTSTIEALPGSFIDQGIQTTPILQGESRNYTFTFSPHSPGPQAATLRFWNNDPDENPFVISLACNGVFPEIAVEEPVGTDLVSGAADIEFGVVTTGATGPPKVFTVKNMGSGPLTTLSAAITGEGAANFALNAGGLPGTVAPGVDCSVIVSFTPWAGTSGNRTAVLSIASSDADENPFEIDLTGLALSPSADADGDGLSDWAEHQYGPLGFDWQIAQPALVATLNDGANAAGLFSRPQMDESRQKGRDEVIGDPNRHGLYTPSQLQALHAGTPLISRDLVTGTFKLKLDWKKSSDLENFADFPALPAGVSVDEHGDILFEFSAPDPAAFFRIELE